MSITQRTTKLVLATCLACFLAYLLDLSSAVSAGIIALLSLSDTRRSTLKLARNRLFSMLLALAIGVLVSADRLSHLESGPLPGSLCASCLQNGLGNRYHT